MTTARAWTPPARPGIVPLYPMTFGTILGRSFVALRGNPRVLLGFAVAMQLVAYLVLIAATGAVGWTTYSRLATVPAGSAEYEAILAGSTAATALTALVLGVAATALTVLVQGVVVAEVAHGVVAETLPLRPLLRTVAPAAWRLVGYTLLTTGAVTVAAGGVVAALVALGAGPAGPAVAVVVGLAVAVVATPVAVWVSVKLMLVPAVLVLERRPILPAIARSWTLVRGRFWVAAGTWLSIQLGFGVLAQLVSVPLTLLGTVLSAIVAPTGDAEVTAVVGMLVTTGLTQVITLLVQSVALVVLASAATLVYVDCRMRSEGLDLDLQSYVAQRQAGAGPADPFSWRLPTGGR